jgi:phosphate transport system permease protein
VAHAIVGTLEQILIATLFAVPLAVATAVFLSEVGGALARPVRIIVEAMTALPDIIAGLFVYALFILTFGMQKSGLAASLALTVTMMPIIARASEVVLRLVPGTLREASYALGSSQWAPYGTWSCPPPGPVWPPRSCSAWPAGSGKPPRS